MVMMIGFLIIYAKFSDIFGAKFMLLLALLIFTVFSIACGAATAMTELYFPFSTLPIPQSHVFALGLTVNQTASSSAPSKESAVQESTPSSAS
jgi:MFS family permease